MSQRIQRTKDEITKAKALDVAEKAAVATLADANAAPKEHDIATRTLKKIKVERKELQEAIAARNVDKKSEITASQADAILTQVQTAFPPLPVEGSKTNWAKVFGEDTSDPQPSEPPHALSLTELEDRKVRVLALLKSLGNEDHFKPARKYLAEMSDTLRDVLRQLKADEKAIQEQKQAARDNREFIAGDEAIRPLREALDARLSKGFLPMKAREEARIKFEKLAEESRHRMRVEIGRESQAEDTLEIRASAIWLAKTHFFEEAAWRLQIFQWDLQNEPPLGTLNVDLWDSGRIFSRPYFAFRPLSEQALIAYVGRRYFNYKEDFIRLAQVPNLPEPIRIPGKSHTPLELIEHYEMARCLNALQPINDESVEVIYNCESNTLEKPHSKPLLLWGDGRPVDTEKEVLWDKRANGFRRMPEPMALEPNWNIGGQRYESEQDEKGEWIKVPVSNSHRESWSQNLEGNWEPDSSMPNGQWKRMPLIKVVQGDHKPLDGDSRTEFRYGHWFTKADVERASQTKLNVHLLPSTGERVVPDQTVHKRDESTPISAEEASWTWRKREVELREQALKSKA